MKEEALKGKQTPEQQAAERYPTAAHTLGISPRKMLDMDHQCDYHREGYAACLRERAIPAEEALAEMIAASRLFAPDSAEIAEGAAESWENMGYNNPERANERFRGGLRQAYIVGWHDSRTDLIGRMIPREEEKEISKLKSQRDRLIAENEQMANTVLVMLETLNGLSDSNPDSTGARETAERRIKELEGFAEMIANGGINAAGEATIEAEARALLNRETEQA